jgi:hypothetical protein
MNNAIINAGIANKRRRIGVFGFKDQNSISMKEGKT